MIRCESLLQAPTVSIYQFVKTITFVLYLFDMVKINKMKKVTKWKSGLKKISYLRLSFETQLKIDFFTTVY